MKAFIGITENVFITINSKDIVSGCFSNSTIEGHIRMGYVHNKKYSYGRHEDNDYDVIKIKENYYYCRYDNKEEITVLVCLNEEEYNDLCRFGIKPTTIEIN